VFPLLFSKVAFTRPREGPQKTKNKRKGEKKHYQKHEDQTIFFVVASHENCSVCFCARWSVLGAVTMRAYARVVLCFLGLKLKAKVSETD
jgi:hypothetical protein